MTNRNFKERANILVMTTPLFHFTTFLLILAVYFAALPEAQADILSLKKIRARVRAQEQYGMAGSKKVIMVKNIAYQELSDLN